MRGCGDGSGGAILCGYQAPSYPVPFATPKHVGYHYFTYPPMMPHNSLPHYRGAYSYRSCDGLARTNVLWHPSYVRNTFKWLHHLIELPR